MNFDLEKKPISVLLKSQKQYTIPRFQREYSWERPQLNEFLDDIIKQIHIVENKLVIKEYFWGTMLFIGSFVDNKKMEMVVVDGQQRITTMTMFLSVLSKTLTKQLQPELADMVWEYIIFKDNNLEKHAVLVNETPNPFFQRLVQTMDRNDDTLAANSEEEERIKLAYEFFEKTLQEKYLRDKFNYFDLDVSEFSYLDLLKIIRDQILSSITICMSTTEKKEAGMIFEILNAKGKSLDDIDLIKNKIFEIMRTETPTDEAKLYWKQTKENLASRGEFIDFSVFFYHYWISKYKKVTSKKLYSDFTRAIPKNEDKYLMFLRELEKASKAYIRIIIPQPNDYENKQELQYIVETLNNLNNSFGIKQHRIVLLGLNYAYFDQKIISAKMYKKTLQSIEYTHFIFNALFKQRTQWLDKVYSKFSISVRKCKNKDETHELIDDLLRSISSEIPTYNLFESKFTELQFSKGKNEDNRKSKFVIQSIAKFIGQLDVTPNGSSIEHIMNEDLSIPTSLSIGNLILLEDKINSKIPNTADFPQKRNFYMGSAYPFVRDFINSEEGKSTWSEEDIKARAKRLSHMFYHEIIGSVLTIGTD